MDSNNSILIFNSSKDSNRWANYTPPETQQPQIRPRIRITPTKSHRPIHKTHNEQPPIIPQSSPPPFHKLNSFLSAWKHQTRKPQQGSASVLLYLGFEGGRFSLSRIESWRRCFLSLPRLRWSASCGGGSRGLHTQTLVSSESFSL